MPPGRPIVSDCNSESYHIAQYIDHFLNPLSTIHPSYLPDTYDFLDKIKPIAVPPHTYIFTIDIDSLYTNIHTATGLQAVRNLFQTHPDNTRPDNAILKLLELSLTCNDFTFNNKHYLQMEGTAMGKKFAPAYANIYMSQWEREALAKCPLQPTMYFRFLDDIIGLWPHTLQQFDTFIHILNTHHTSITIKHIIHPTEVNFLDTTVFFNTIEPTHKRLLTRIYFKDTDTHALLHKHSYHPKHTFAGIIKSQIIRFFRISSNHTLFNQATHTLFTVLRRRGYSKRFLRTVKNNALASLSPTQSPSISTHPDTPPTTPNPNHSFPPQTTHLDQGPLSGAGTGVDLERAHTSPSPPLSPLSPPSSILSHTTQPTSFSTTTTLLPLITTFSHTLQPLHHKFKQNFTTTQQSYPPLQTHKVISALRRNKNLGDLLVHSSFSTLPPKPPQPHTLHFKTRKFINNPHGHTSCPIQDPLSLTTSNLIYIITCTHCHKHYIGETKHTLETRLKQHLYHIRRADLHTTLYTHFQSHPITNLIISGLECGVRWTSGQRKLMEHRWIKKLKTITPTGLNEKS